MVEHERKWWKEGTVYQIYPSSFCDSNGDGIGDIAGIQSKLDYLKDLGIDIIWLSPHYKSPQVDMGYDISDYKDIHAPYGTLQDTVDLINNCHSRGLKIIFDLVVNHTSDQHAWFQESRKSKDSPKRDWYIWHDGKLDSNGRRVPPNNWEAYFGGSAWEWDETSQQYYLHLFCKEQPDLNWENPTVREAIYEDACNFWLEKGVDGFRIDTVNLYSKTPGFPDAPIIDPGAEFQAGFKLYCNGPRMHEFLKEMHDKTFGRYDTFTVGELGNTSDDLVLDYVSAKRKELSEVFKFNVVETGRNEAKDRFLVNPWKLPEFKSGFVANQKLIEGTDAWTTTFVENHDQPRSISRFGNDSKEYYEITGKLIATLLAGMSGTLYIYQGQEIGMTNASRDWTIEDYKDVASIDYFNIYKNRYGLKKAMEAGMDNLQKAARDHSRTPVQWDDSEHAGFTSGTPWMRVNENYKYINVKSQLENNGSVLQYYRQALKVRKQYKDLFVYGSFTLLDKDNENVFTYVKEYGTQKAIFYLNFSTERQPLPEVEGFEQSNLVLSNIPGEVTTDLSPYEGRIYVSV